MRLTSAAITAFQAQLFEYYLEHKRAMPWREVRTDGTVNPYYVLVSEMMLQQTQVTRVMPKFNQFIAVFPTVQSLAKAKLSTVLAQWSGLGYNRRAKFLWQAAQAIVNEQGGTIPENPAELAKLPGIGKNTAAAIAVYAYNRPELFIETNIRAVYIHHFFKDTEDVADSDILEILKKTLDSSNPREFYWALMDYGSHIKKTIGNVTRRSKSYKKQSAFHGSRRQVRGHILRRLGEGAKTKHQLTNEFPDDRFLGVLDDLVREQLISVHNGRYRLG